MAQVWNSPLICLSLFGSLEDGAREINAALSAGLDVVVTPGIYKLEASMPAKYHGVFICEDCELGEVCQTTAGIVEMQGASISVRL